MIEEGQGEWFFLWSWYQNLVSVIARDFLEKNWTMTNYSHTFCGQYNYEFPPVGRHACLKGRWGGVFLHYLLWKRRVEGGGNGEVGKENREGEEGKGKRGKWGGGHKTTKNNTQGSFNPTSTAFLKPKIEDMVNWVNKQVYLTGLLCISAQEILNYTYGDTNGKLNLFITSNWLKLPSAIFKVLFIM